MPSTDESRLLSRRRAIELGAVGFGALLGGCVAGDAGGQSDTTVASPATDETPTTDETTQFPPPEPTSEEPTDARPLPTGSDWPRVGHDDANTGHAPVTAVPGESEVYWHFFTQSTPPVVSDGKTYAVEHARDTYLLSRDASTAEKQWTTTFSGGAFAPPVVAEDRVVLQTYSFLWAFDRSGEELWQYDLGRGIPGSPVVRDGRVYGCTGSFEHWSPTAFAVAADGTERWTVELDGDVRGSPAADEDTLYVGTGAGTLYALALPDGSERWSVQLGDGTAGTATVADGAVYVADRDDTIHARSAADGSSLWTAGVDTSGDESLAVADGSVFVPATDAVVSLSTDDGTEQWRRSVGSPTAPSVGESAVYVGGTTADDPNVYAIDRETGDVAWHHRTESKQVSDQIFTGVSGPPIPVEGGLYAVAADGLYAFGAP
ncbi:MAG: PQQ-binding-like beta-propeller repeat protein [Haloferacaceae archaeon]